MFCDRSKSYREQQLKEFQKLYKQSSQKELSPYNRFQASQRSVLTHQIMGSSQSCVSLAQY